MFFVNDWEMFEKLHDWHNDDSLTQFQKYLPFEMRNTNYKMLMNRTIADGVKNARLFNKLTKGVNVNTLMPIESFKKKYIKENLKNDSVNIDYEKFKENFDNVKNKYSNGVEINEFYNGKLKDLDENGLYNLMALKKYSYIPKKPYSADILNKLTANDIFLNSASSEVLNLDLISNAVHSKDYNDLSIYEKQGVQDVWLNRKGIDDYGLNKIKETSNFINNVVQLFTLTGSAYRNIPTGAFEGVIYGGKALNKWVSSPEIRKLTKNGVISDAFEALRLRDAKFGNKEIYNNYFKKAVNMGNHALDFTYKIGDVAARTGKLIDVMFTLANPGKKGENLHNLISKHTFGDQLDAFEKFKNLSDVIKNEDFNLKEYLDKSPNVKEYLQNMIDDSNFSFTSLGEATSIVLRSNANNAVSKMFYSLMNTFLRYSLSLVSKYVSSAAQQMHMTKQNPFNLSIGPLMPFILMQAGKGLIEDFLKDLSREKFSEVYKKYNDNMYDIFNKHIVAQFGTEPSSWIMKGNKTFLASRIQYLWKSIDKIGSDENLSSAEKTNLIAGMFFQPWGVIYHQTHGLNTRNFKQSKKPKKEPKSISLD